MEGDSPRFLWGFRVSLRVGIWVSFCFSNLEKKLGTDHTSKLQGEMNCQGVWGVFHITRQSGLDAVISVCDDVLNAQEQKGSDAPSSSTEVQEATTAAPTGEKEEEATEEKPASTEKHMLMRQHRRAALHFS